MSQKYVGSNVQPLSQNRSTAHSLANGVTVVAWWRRERHMQRSGRICHRHSVARGQDRQCHACPVVQCVRGCHRHHVSRGSEKCFPLPQGVYCRHSEEGRGPTLKYK